MNKAIAFLDGSEYSFDNDAMLLASRKVCRSRPGSTLASNSIMDSGMNIAFLILAPLVAPWGSINDIRPLLSVRMCAIEFLSEYLST